MNSKYVLRVMLTFEVILSTAQNWEVITLAGKVSFSQTSGFKDGSGTTATFNYPYSVASDIFGRVYVSDSFNNIIRQITSSGAVSTYVGSTSGSSDGYGTSASFKMPYGIATDTYSNVYVADNSNHMIRKININRLCVTLAGSSTSGADDGTGTSAQFSFPLAITVDLSFNAYVSDGSSRIRKISADGIVTTFVGSSSGYRDGTGTTALFYSPAGLAVDSSMYLYVADSWNNIIRKISSNGIVTTFAGQRNNSVCVDGTGTKATFYKPLGVAVDTSGNILVADTYNYRIRKITSVGMTSTLAGSSTSGWVDGMGTSAAFMGPFSVNVDSNGHIYISDAFNNRIRKIPYAITPSSQPTGKPSHQPSIQPSRQPMGQPTSTPTLLPSYKPSSQPSEQPTIQPTRRPSRRPTTQPTSRPKASPTCQPSSTPTSLPSTQPSRQPAMQPSLQPAPRPSSQPSQAPTLQPSNKPTSQPSSQPASLPSATPTNGPSMQPSGRPTRQPSRQPTIYPSERPSISPSSQPTIKPSQHPRGQPSAQPTKQPSSRPSSHPSRQPTSQPTHQPTTRSSTRPTRQPTGQPSRQPTRQPSSQPSLQPSLQPSRKPSSQPSLQPSVQPSSQPSVQPSRQPSCQPSLQPARTPTCTPSTQPSCHPSCTPTDQPTSQPFSKPSKQPSSQPSFQPRCQPTSSPTAQPSCQPSIHPSRFPSVQPSRQPSSQPTHQPSVQPTLQPTTHPSAQPSAQPTKQPSCQPSYQPVSHPTCSPSRRPSRQPICKPTMQPSTAPSTQPSITPSAQPSFQPSQQPSIQPNMQPTAQPSKQPTSQPSCQPSRQPTRQPARCPSSQPTYRPSRHPTRQPSRQPSSRPSAIPTMQPSRFPSNTPTLIPSIQPSNIPTVQPSMQPTDQPSCQPSAQPSVQPSRVPTKVPSVLPSQQPTQQPSAQPTSKPSRQPTVQPISRPTNRPSPRPTRQPIGDPTTQPSSQPSTQPLKQPSMQPSRQPSRQPSSQPTRQPTRQPVSIPTRQPSAQPFIRPTVQPSSQPISQPSYQPTQQPSLQPSKQPLHRPTSQPSRHPTDQPTASPSSLPSLHPSGSPTKVPSELPSSQPTEQPTLQPTSQPSRQPQRKPSSQPSHEPTYHPTGQPSSVPIMQPTAQPSIEPSSHPIGQPTFQPTCQPTAQPSRQPSRFPSSKPSKQPSRQPSRQPSIQPSFQPSNHPTSQPTVQPSRQPVRSPSSQPISQPTRQPSIQPFIRPSSQPSMQPTGQPHRQPSTQPSSLPTRQPISQPSKQPTVTPSKQPANVPSRQPSVQPIRIPSMQPTVQPINGPSAHPSHQPTATPSTQPQSLPTSAPSCTPTRIPSNRPTHRPSPTPSSFPSRPPSVAPTVQPSSLPSEQPTRQPINRPSLQPSHQPAGRPSKTPTGQPTTNPTAVPSLVPSVQPTRRPTTQPTTTPSGNPTGQPSMYPSAQPTGTPSLQPKSQPSSNPSCSPSTQLPTMQPSSQPSSRPSVYIDVLKYVENCSAWLDSEHTLNTYSNPLIPVVQISSPYSIGSCSSLTLDISASSGSCGHEWRSINFTVSIENGGPGADTAASAIALYLNSDYVISPPSPIPVQLISEKGCVYVFDIMMCSVLGLCGSGRRYVQVLDRPVPTVSIAGPAVQLVYRYQLLSVASVATMQGCIGGIVSPSQEMNYTWSLKDIFNISVAVESVTMDSTKYVLPAYTLSSNQEYTLWVRVAGSRTDNANIGRAVSNAAKASVKIIVQIGDLVASISGGSYQTLRLFSNLTLDGSQSFDKDQPGSSRSGMQFSWSCRPIDQHSSSVTGCILFGNQKLRRTTTTKVTAALHSANTTSLVALRVFDSTRVGTTTTVIQVLSSDAPSVTIAAALVAATKVNTNKPLFLYGTVQLHAGAQGDGGIAYWSLSDPTVDLNAVSLSPTMLPLAPDAASDAPLASLGFNLIIAANSLPPRSSLVFTLEAVQMLFNNDTVSAMASIAIVTNGPPLPGSFLVQPTAGVEFSTIFTFAASNWIDEDVPIMYEFGFFDASFTYLVAQAASMSSFGNTLLPSITTAASTATDTGTDTGSSLTWCQAQVYDSLGANSSATTAVTVGSQPAAQLLSILSASLSQQLAQTGFSVDERKQLVAVFSVALNAVDCSATPINCATLSRLPCSTQPNTCGPCLPGIGLVGEDGPSNTACVSASSLSHVAAQGTSKCSIDIVCGAWHVCDSTSKCTPTLKQCSNGCSGHGSCTYSSVSTGTAVHTCYTSTTSCVAMCVCTADFFGPACSITATDFALKQSARDVLVSALGDVIYSEFPSVQAVSAWANALSSVSSSPHELSVSSQETLLQLSNAVLAAAIQHPSVSASDVAPSLVNAVDSLSISWQATNSMLTWKQQRRRLVSTDAAAWPANSTLPPENLRGMIDALGLFMAKEMIPGQFPSSVLLSSFRLTVATFAAASVVSSGSSSVSSSAEAQTVALPRSPLESSVGTEASSVLGLRPLAPGAVIISSLHSNTFSSSRYIGKDAESAALLGLTSSAQSTRGVGATRNADVDMATSPMIVSPSLRLVYPSPVCANQPPPSPPLTIPEIHFVIQFDSSLVAFGPSNVTTQCLRGERKTVSHKCLSGTNITVFCDGYYDRVLVTECPRQQPSFTCEILSTTSTALNLSTSSTSSASSTPFSSSISCRVVRATNAFVECACQLCSVVTASDRNRLLSLLPFSRTKRSSHSSQQAALIPGGATGISVLEVLPVLTYKNEYFPSVSIAGGKYDTPANPRIPSIVITTFVTVWVCAVVITLCIEIHTRLFVSKAAKHSDIDKETAATTAAALPKPAVRSNNPSSLDHSHADAEASPNATHARLKARQFVDSYTCPIFRYRDPLSSRIWKCVQRNHFYISACVITATAPTGTAPTDTGSTGTAAGVGASLWTSEGYERVVNTLFVLTRVTWTLFLVMAFFADTWSLDQNACAAYTTQEACESMRRGALSTRGSVCGFCVWKPTIDFRGVLALSTAVVGGLGSAASSSDYSSFNTTYEGLGLGIDGAHMSCHWIPPTFRAAAPQFILLSLLVMLVSAPLHAFLGWLRQAVLWPTREDLGLPMSAVGMVIRQSSLLPLGSRDAYPHNAQSQQDPPLQRLCNVIVAKYTHVVDLIVLLSFGQSGHHRPHRLAGIPAANSLGSVRDEYVRLQSNEATNGSTTGIGNFDDFQALMLDLSLTAPTVAHLSPGASHRFWSQWGAVLNSNEYGMLTAPTAATRLNAECQAVHKEVASFIDKVSLLPPLETARKMVELFLCDLVGRDSAAAQLFSAHLSHYSMQTDVVISRFLRGCSIGAVLLMDLLLIIESINRARNKGPQWQQAWLKSAACNVVLDMAIVEMIAIVVVFVGIPRLADSSLANAMLTLESTTVTYFTTMKRLTTTTAISSSSSSSSSISKRTSAAVPHDLIHFDSTSTASAFSAFSATDYLFVSSKCARMFPQLPESMMVSLYRSPIVSHTQYEKWTVGRDKAGTGKSFRDAVNAVREIICMQKGTESKRFGLAAAEAVKKTLLQMGGLPVWVQLVITKSTLIPCILAAFAFLGSAALQSSVTGVGLGLALFVLFLVFLIWLQRKSRSRKLSTKSKVSPFNEAHEIHEEHEEKQDAAFRTEWEVAGGIDRSSLLRPDWLIRPPRGDSGGGGGAAAVDISLSGSDIVIDSASFSASEIMPLRKDGGGALSSGIEKYDDGVDEEAEADELPALLGASTRDWDVHTGEFQGDACSTGSSAHLYHAGSSMDSGDIDIDSHSHNHNHSHSRSRSHSDAGEVSEVLEVLTPFRSDKVDTLKSTWQDIDMDIDIASDSPQQLIMESLRDRWKYAKQGGSIHFKSHHQGENTICGNQDEDNSSSAQVPKIPQVPNIPQDKGSVRTLLPGSNRENNVRMEIAFLSSPTDLQHQKLAALNWPSDFEGREADTEVNFAADETGSEIHEDAVLSLRRQEVDQLITGQDEISQYASDASPLLAPRGTQEDENSGVGYYSDGDDEDENDCNNEDNLFWSQFA